MVADDQGERRSGRSIAHREPEAPQPLLREPAGCEVARNPNRERSTLDDILFARLIVPRVAQPNPSQVSFGSRN
jgi:hypothetical protein